MMNRRTFLKYSASGTLSAALGTAVLGDSTAAGRRGLIHTVLGPIDPAQLGACLMHEHAPVVDWSELYETPPAPIAPVRERMLERTTKLLDAFHETLANDDGPGAIVETTPIRVGRYPRLLVALAKRTKVHIIASTGFWCEALAPQHPWAVRLSVEKGGTRKMAELFLREIDSGMEDPSGKWGERFTGIKAGIIKIGTSTYLRPSERVIHAAAAIASKETGCPITTHTTDGGGLEQAKFLLKNGAQPEKIIIGHQGYKDDRENDEALEYHRRLADLGVSVQYDRVGHGRYTCDSQARQIKDLIDHGFVEQILVSHDNVPYFYADFSEGEKKPENWKSSDSHYTTITTQLVESLGKVGVSRAQVRNMLVDNPKRVLTF